MEAFDVIVIGSGLGSLSAASLLSKNGLRVCVLEQANYPGGCASTYKRKGAWFETGATTLVGLDDGMPLNFLLNELGIELAARKLQIPMQVQLTNGTVVTRHNNFESWVQEAERVFGQHGQREFWQYCYNVSQKVWRTSIKQRHFPISNFKDLYLSLKNTTWEQLSLVPKAFKTIDDLLREFNLQYNKLFLEFIDEQLLITAQNYRKEVNELFGATALCYTLFGNYYLDGGLITLAKALVNYIQHNNGEVKYRYEVTDITPDSDGYKVSTSKGELRSKFVISGLPLNNTATLFKETLISQKLKPYILPANKLNGAFTMGVLLKEMPAPEVLHHQVHIPESLPIINSKSVFVSFSHPQDMQRANSGYLVASISTHVHNPAKNWIKDKSKVEEAILTALQKAGLIHKGNIIYEQAATPGAWIFWTKRAFGAVGGYPQYAAIKPWQMKDARLDHKGAYVCGDTVYPGQGIPGVCLSGIIAAEKLLQDHF